MCLHNWPNPTQVCCREDKQLPITDTGRLRAAFPCANLAFLLLQQKSCYHQNYLKLVFFNFLMNGRELVEGFFTSLWFCFCIIYIALIS